MVKVKPIIEALNETDVSSHWNQLKRFVTSACYQGRYLSYICIVRGLVGTIVPAAVTKMQGSSQPPKGRRKVYASSRGKQARCQFGNVHTAVCEDAIFRFGFDPGFSVIFCHFISVIKQASPCQGQQLQ